jgi:ABC-2 type transport system permease protein
MRSGYATFVRNWRVTLRAYTWSFFIGGLLTGGLTVAIAYCAYHLLAGEEVGARFTQLVGAGNYMSYVILGAAIYLFAVRILLGISRSLITERREGTLESLLLAPSGRLSYFAGISAQWMLVSAGELAVLLLLTWPLGLNLRGVDWLALALAVPVALLGCVGLAMMLGALMLATGDTYISQNTLFTAMGLLCGFVFPPQFLPTALQWLGDALPVTGAVRLLRSAALYGQAPAALAGDLAIYSVLGLMYAVAGLAVMRRAERHALEGGA